MLGDTGAVTGLQRTWRGGDPDWQLEKLSKFIWKISGVVMSQVKVVVDGSVDTDLYVEVVLE